MDKEIRQIQEKCIEILDIFDAICKRNGIQYSLCGGSVVGAYLYKGCLPWDDDVDVMMTRENYDKFLSVIKNELPQGYSVQNFLFSNSFSSTFTKIIDDNTTIVQKDGCVSGVFLDVDVYDRVPLNFMARIDVLLWQLSQIVMVGKQFDGSIKSRFRNMILSTFFKDKRKYLLLFQRIVTFLGRKSKKYCYSELFGAYCNTKPFRPSVFENYSEIEFEGKKYMIVRDYVEYLQTRYDRTDFREPKEKQISPHYIFVDLNLPCKEYLKKMG